MASRSITRHPRSRKHFGEDIRGQIFGRLEAVRFSHKNKKDMTFWLFRCRCGEFKVISKAEVKRGKTRSCGCLCRDRTRAMLRARNTTHGMSGTRIFHVYHGMINRCYNVRNKSFVRYGGRGIAVCDEWRNSPHSFFTWANANGYRRGLELDRRENDGNYEPSNCRWVTDGINQNNRSNTVLISANGERLGLGEWSKRTGISPRTLYARLKQYGWDEDAVINTPFGKKVRARKIL